MKTAGIICECNPFHSGHKHLITMAKESCDAVICVMSGYFTERGEAAISDPYTRAEALIHGGADLVLELPYPYSAAGADYFADAGVDILSRLGVTELWFGSECGSVERLSHAARVTLSDEFAQRYAKTATEAVGAARAYFDTLAALCGDGDAFYSNDVLGISYLRALMRRQSTMRPITIPREGSAYLDSALSENGHPSATALRRLLLTSGFDAARAHLLPETATAIEKAQQAGHFPADLHYAERAILSFLRLCDPELLSSLAELGGGLGNRLVSAAKQATSLDELLSLASTKKYTESRLRRAILFALTGVKKEDLTAAPSYVTVLAANPTGCAFLAHQRKVGSIPTVTRSSDVPTNGASVAQKSLREAAISLYSLTLREPTAPQSLLVSNPVILK
ncbi:MAG: nucleotidyltransferase family protein [Clostridia bacterium]|nr:nucleotidyltransferase family protein [Clostridia bacterium]